MANQIKKKYLVPEIFTDITGEIDGKVGAEEARALAAEAALQANIDTEETRALAAEAALGVRIDNVLSNIDPAAVDSFTEVVAAFEAADGNLQTSITNLSTAASADRALIRSEFAAADSALQISIDAVQADVDQNEADGDADRALIRSEFAAADTALYGTISNEVGVAFESLKDSNSGDWQAAGRGDLHDEFGKLEAADVTLQGNIDAEASARAAADSALQISIDANATAISAEETRALAAEAALGVRIDDVLSNIDPAAVDSFTEVVAAFEAADGNLQTSITNLSTAASDDRALIRSEFAAADTALYGTISNEVGVAFESLKDSNSGDWQAAGRGDLHDEFGKLEAADSAATADRAAIRSEFAAADASLQAQIDALDTGYVSEAEFAVEKAKISTAEGRLDAIEALAFYKESAVVAASNDFVLANAPMANSLSVFVGRLALIEGVDYSVSGSTVTIIGELALGSGDDEEMVAGENVYFQYYK